MFWCLFVYFVCVCFVCVCVCVCDENRTAATGSFVIAGFIRTTGFPENLLVERDLKKCNHNKKALLKKNPWYFYLSGHAFWHIFVNLDIIGTCFATYYYYLWRNDNPCTKVIDASDWT